MKTRNLFRLFIISCLVLLLSLTTVAQVLPTEMDTITARKINGADEGTCTCCNFHKCSDLDSRCGSNSYATSGNAGAKPCNCNLGTTNPCSHYAPCDGKLSGTGNECGSGDC